MEQWFTSEYITLRMNPEGKKSKDKLGKEYLTSVAYCKDVKGFIKFIKNGRHIKNADLLISGKGSRKKNLNLIIFLTS